MGNNISKHRIWLERSNLSRLPSRLLTSRSFKDVIVFAGHNQLSAKYMSDICSNKGNVLLQEIQTLDLRGNYMNEFPDLHGLPKLQTLDLSKYYHLGLMDFLDGCMYDLCNACCESVYDALFLYSRLNAITEIPSSVGKLTALTNLNLSYNLITRIDPALKNCVSLRTLKLSYNSDLTAKSFPDDLRHLNLTTLTIQSCLKIKEIPLCVFFMKDLVTLNLNYCDIKTISPLISHLQNLRKLGVARNNLKTLPPEIGLLELTELNVQNNDISKEGGFPRSMRRLTELSVIGAMGNLGVTKDVRYTPNKRVAQLVLNEITRLAPEIQGTLKIPPKPVFNDLFVQEHIDEVPSPAPDVGVAGLEIMPPSPVEEPDPNPVEESIMKIEKTPVVEAPPLAVPPIDETSPYITSADSSNILSKNEFARLLKNLRRDFQLNQRIDVLQESCILSDRVFTCNQLGQILCTIDKCMSRTRTRLLVLENGMEEEVDNSMTESLVNILGLVVPRLVDPEKFDSDALANLRPNRAEMLRDVMEELKESEAKRVTGIEPNEATSDIYTVSNDSMYKGIGGESTGQYGNSVLDSFY